MREMDHIVLYGLYIVLEGCCDMTMLMLWLMGTERSGRSKTKQRDTDSQIKLRETDIEIKLRETDIEIKLRETDSKIKLRETDIEGK